MSIHVPEVVRVSPKLGWDVPEVAPPDRSIYKVFKKFGHYLFSLQISIFFTYF